MPIPSITHKNCTLCGNCVDLCPMQCFEIKDKKVEITKPKACIGCQACVIQCDPRCIKILDD